MNKLHRETVRTILLSKNKMTRKTFKVLITYNSYTFSLADLYPKFDKDFEKPTCVAKIANNWSLLRCYLKQFRVQLC